MSKNPLVSIIIPAFNAANTITDTLTSALKQTYNNIEIIIVDDNSTDATAKIVGAISAKFKNVTYHRNAINKGPAASRNTGILLSSGEYVALLDADDMWFPEKIEKQIDYFLSHPDVSLVFCKSKILRYDGRLDYLNMTFPHDFFSNPKNVYERLLLGNFINTLSVMVKRDVLKEAGYFDETLFLTEDHDLWLRILEKDFKFGFINEFLGIYRDNPIGTSKNTAKFEKAKLDFLNKHVDNNLKLDNSFIKRCYSCAYLDIGLGYYKENDMKSARSFLIRSMNYDRTNLKAYLFYLKSLLGAHIVKALKVVKGIFLHEKFN